MTFSLNNSKNVLISLSFPYSDFEVIQNTDNDNHFQIKKTPINKNGSLSGELDN
ncbi:hypothetical protein HMPREF1563_0898 [Providencia alcalifaciens 205/92]|uniref:Uncharacterized protein n=1 Tax=Providencia alcalifaciens 205/92 TaxID=1256988 RepID=A0AAV3M7L4_9GAMM|nr:hypothetical protein HMPREF1563_0898 [Providencia alcalifaciens 205/92]